MTRQPNQKHETPADDTEVEITPLSPEEQEAVAHLVEKPNLRFGGRRYANGFIIPDHIPIEPEKD